MDNKTVGSASFDLMQQQHTPESAIDYERVMHKDFENEINNCITRHLTAFTGDFFVVVIRKRERLMSNVYRNYFFARKSCPTPTYDQIVYRYNRTPGTIEFIWVVPDLETATIFKNHALEVTPEEKGLLNFVLSFYDGTLDKLAQTFNNEV
jgi:hypothetical protein